MNHLNWVQQSEDYKTRYHVLKWETSHFHEPFSRQMAASARLQQGAAAAAPSNGMEKEPEGIGQGSAGGRGNGRLRPGFGLENFPAKSLAGEERGSVDEVSLSSHGMERQEEMAGTARAAVQSVTLAQTHAAENTIAPVSNAEKSAEAQEERADRENTTVSESASGNIRNRLKESAARLREFYQRQKEKAAKMPLRQVRQEEEKDNMRNGTRAADRETMLSMQAGNHYLLDSYDRNGNYSTLGKK